MNFLWPEMLWLLAAVPLLILLYVWALRRRKKIALRYASLSLVREAVGRGPGWRRHVPPLLFLSALTLMLAAVARPTAVVTLPSQHDLVVLAIDVSRSMLAEDVKPSRIVAAQEAARTFVNEQPINTRIAVVAFAGAAALVQSPTNVKSDILSAIDRFQLQRATAIGNAIVVSLATIFPDAGIDVANMGARSAAGSLDGPTEMPPSAPENFKPVAPGSYGSAAIILLTDGQTTTGVDPVEAAKMAADRGVKVFTVGVGTPDGEILRTEGWSMRVRLDEESLKSIASITQGEYYYAGTALDLKRIYQTLNAKLVFETKETEITALFSAAAAALAVLAAMLSIIWFNRVL